MRCQGSGNSKDSLLQVIKLNPFPTSLILNIPIMLWYATVGILDGVAGGLSIKGRGLVQDGRLNSVASCHGDA